eukprot:m.442104 g.442104  ORF g.442104 m.442104 type:complete len:647 (-) comp18751_c0_seq1:78-2018(-)
MTYLLLASALALGKQQSTAPSFLFLLGDDIGWADFSYNNGTAASPRIKEWTQTPGTITMQDFHSGGTVCSPTRATILTGRNHFRDCVDYVYGCSDMTECVPHFNFAPQRTFTIGDAARAANKNYTSFFAGKWHLGSFYNDSEAYGGVTSSPITHGFDFFNATVEVAPTATTNCECTQEWYKNCNFGHNNGPTHCNGKGNPGGGTPLKPGCCFNYWWNDVDSDHGVTNLTTPSPDNDARDYLADSFVRFLEARDGAPFMAQISIHNCHDPFIGTLEERAKCNETDSCNAPLPGAAPYSSAELDFYACLNELDESVGVMLDALKTNGYYENTMIWFTTDNGPEVNCHPEGRCGGGSTIPPGTLHRPASNGPGSAGPLRGRKRDVWEGGHRVPGIISWPAVVTGPPRVSWDPVITMDFLATVMEVLDVERPASQKDWAFDGVSVMPILRGETPAVREFGHMYMTATASVKDGYSYRYGNWKLAVGGISCDPGQASFDCSKPQLYNMASDIAEDMNLAEKEPEILAAIMANFTRWQKSVLNSMANESMCSNTPGPTPSAPFPAHPQPSTQCKITQDSGLSGNDIAHGVVQTYEECCGACKMIDACKGADFRPASKMRPAFDGSSTGGTCHIKAAFQPNGQAPGAVACQPL